MSVEQRWSKVFNWQKLRSEAVVPLLSGRHARWHPIDFNAGPDSQGRYRMDTEVQRAEPASVIILDGVYTSGPQMADLVGLSVLVEVSEITRRTRLAKREEPEFLAQWHARWDAVEDFYFSSIRPRNRLTSSCPLSRTWRRRPGGTRQSWRARIRLVQATLRCEHRFEHELTLVVDVLSAPNTSAHCRFPSMALCGPGPGSRAGAGE